MSTIPHTGTDVGGVIEVRGPDGRRTARDRRARECLFGCPGGLQVDRPLFDGRGVPEGAREDVLDDEVDHSHSYATRAEVAAVDRDAPLNDRADGNHVGVWLPGPDGGLVLDHVTGTPPAVLDAAEELFGEDLWPFEWPPGGEVRRAGAVYRPVVYTPRMFAPPDGPAWGPVQAAMRDLAAVHGDENVRLVVWFG